MEKSKVLKLSEGERVVRNYNYGNTKSHKFGLVKDNVIVTTQRVIIEKTEGTGFKRVEIPVPYINSVETSYRKLRVRKLLPFIILVLTLGLAYAFYEELYKTYFEIPVFLADPKMQEAVIYGVFALLGLVSLIKLFRPGYIAISLSFMTYTGVPSELGTISSTSGKWSKKKGYVADTKTEIRTMEVKVRKQALYLVNEIGALILNIQKKCHQK